VSGLRQTQAYYDRLSRWYDLLSGPAERGHIRHGAELLNIQPGERVLEIGFGTGAMLSLLAARAGSNGKVYGLDLSLGMAEAASQRLRRMALVKRPSLVCGDARALPFPAGCLEAVFLSFTLELFPEPEILRVLGECRRVLTPGGRLGVVALFRPAGPHRGVALYDALRRRFPRAIDCQPIAAPDWIARAGFAIVEVRQPSLAGFLPLAIVLARKSE
jgi:demethylmenaquinone methyltransferase/2-methoxy-6-polyprenyl-1,4-benzoquinol methylase